MRIDKNGTIVLSRRNLLTLLHKLDVPGSARMILKGGVAVRSEDDDEHYKGGEAGRMTADTEEYIREHGGRAPKLSAKQLVKLLKGFYW